jgi:hypothetical protein
MKDANVKELVANLKSSTTKPTIDLSGKTSD